MMLREGVNKKNIDPKRGNKSSPVRNVILALSYLFLHVLPNNFEEGTP